ncbi:DUF493 domain-containing protein [bacterium]|nr:DUF493 domain-containing protein [bacterium]
MEKDYDNLKNKLEKDFSWPSVYMFKFIVPSDNQKIALVEKEFGDEATINIRQSSGGKFTSITVKELMLNPEEVIKRYQKLDRIEGIMSL